MGKDMTQNDRVKAPFLGARAIGLFTALLALTVSGGASAQAPAAPAAEPPPPGADVGGDFKTVPLCHGPSQLGCVIAYASFRETNPPLENSRFGRPRTPAPGMVAACVNPANLAGGVGPLHSYLTAGADWIAPSAQPPIQWVAGKTVSTPFVSVPGLVTAQCASTPGFNFLSVHINADPASPRTSELRGDVIVGGQVQQDWGPHLIDANLAMGNLVDIVSPGRRGLDGEIELGSTAPVKILLIGKPGSITHWLEDAAAALRAEGHLMRIGAVRRSWLEPRLEAALIQPLADALASAAARFAPELILAIGGYHIPPPFLQRLAASRGRPPVVGWVGDAFDETARTSAALYDLVAYTDTGLLARHEAMNFPGKAVFLPHAANLAAARPPGRSRSATMIFIGAATPARLAVAEAIAAPASFQGPGWGRLRGGRHRVNARRIPHGAVAGLYASHLAALNVRNEFNVVAGLNQRGFDPCLSATPVVTDAQGDLSLCFEPGAEVAVWRSLDELNAIYERFRRFPGEAAAIGEAGRRRVLADHGFGRRLAALMAAL